jgi:hypothetical protein
MTGAPGGTESGAEGEREDGSSQEVRPQGAHAPKATRRGRRSKPEPNLRNLYSSTTSGVRVERPTVVAIRSDRELDRWVRQEQAGNPHGMPQIDVDFGRNRQAWAVFLPKSPGGSRLTIVRVNYDGRTPEVYASLTVPGRGCKVLGSATHPTAWAETRTLAGDPQLHVNTILTRCN